MNMLNGHELGGKEVFIHVGFPKTATTYFQNKVFPLLQTTYFLNTPFCTYFHGFKQLQFYDDIIYDKEVIIRELRKIQADKILLSHELFVGDLIRRGIIASRLSELFPNAKIIMFIRGQFDILKSAYNFAARNQGYKGTISNLFFVPDKNYKSYSLEDYEAGKKKPLRERYVDPSGIHLDSFNYFDIISIYKKYFANVNVFLYEDFKTQPEKVLKQILNLVKDPLDVNEINSKSFMNKSQDTKSVIHKITNTIISESNARGKDSSLFKGKLLMFKSRNMNKSRRNVLKKIIEKGYKEFFEDLEDRKYYVENNRMLREHYPEIGIQNYKEQYPQ